jgi:uncharacterized SAM-binding protein YcdF (DUF218 family)
MGRLRPVRRPRRQRDALWLRAIAVAVPVLVAIWVFGLIEFAAIVPAPGPEPEDRTDAVVVLTGGSDRLEAGLRLLADGKASKLFVSGVYHTVDVAALLRVSRARPSDVECCIALGYVADSTAGNAEETAVWMQAENLRSLRLVTASYHMPRSLLEFRRALPGIAIVPHPVFPERFKQDEWWRWPGTLSLLVSEYTKYLLALARGPFVAAGGG